MGGARDLGAIAPCQHRITPVNTPGITGLTPLNCQHTNRYGDQNIDILRPSLINHCKLSDFVVGNIKVEVLTLDNSAQSKI